MHSIHICNGIKNKYSNIRFKVSCQKIPATSGSETIIYNDFKPMLPAVFSTTLSIYNII